MDDMTIDERRRALIEKLRSGNLQQTNRLDGALLRQTITWVSDNPYDPEDWNGHFVPDKNSRQYCCIGVGDMLIRPDFYENFADDNEYDYETGYENFRDYYDVNRDFTTRLANMNDGEWHQRSKFSPAIANRRLQYPQRDFKFIARYLEVIWFHNA